MTHPVYFVSLGPGDPELITLKGLKTLQQADIIYCPGTKNAEGTLNSRSAGIVESLGIVNPVFIYSLSMSKNRTLAFQAYDTLYEKIRVAHQDGKKVVIVAEGDASFYSSIQYLSDKLTSANIPVERIAGVPAFIAAGSLTGLQIVEQEEQLHIIPGVTSEEELTSLLQRKYTLVIMKVSLCKEVLQEYLSKKPKLQCHYFENIGGEKQFYTTDPLEIMTRDIPYFSLLIIHPQ